MYLMMTHSSFDVCLLLLYEYDPPHSMEAYNTNPKAEAKSMLLMERRAKLKILLESEMKQLEVCGCK